MGKKIIVFMTLVGVSLVYNTFAAVENIKVGGDITTYAIDRSNFGFGAGADDINLMASITNLMFDADLTEDVLVTAVITDERVWGAESELFLNQGYVTFSNLFDYPLTVKIGLQPIILGSGILVGDPDSNKFTEHTTPFSVVSGNFIEDLSPRKSFAGIVTKYDINEDMLSSLTLAYLKPDTDNSRFQSEGKGDENDDTNIYVAYFQSVIGPNIMGDLYFVYKDTQSQTPWQPFQGADVGNLGLRIQSKPLENLIIFLEYIYQYGKGENEIIFGTPIRWDGKHRSDNLFNIGGQYTFSDFPMSPALRGSFYLLTEHWDPMFENVTVGRIANALFCGTNGKVISAGVTLNLREDLSFSVDYFRADTYESEGIKVAGDQYALLLAPPFGNSLDPSKKHVFDEVDITLSYAYTEDIQFSFIADYLKPGSFFTEANDKSAHQIIASMKVSF
ncbi:MAG: hypothetical protein NC820_07210 [Candidatus Omnitrophica bacterium]|nr:hypothetical protein [Candidatus Omnitrophota bacterium]